MSSNLSLLVEQTNTANFVIAPSPVPVPQDNEILVRVEKFGFSTNNITYANLGKDPHFRYFEFFPVPETTAPISRNQYGNIPVWGFGTVVQSKHPKIKTGEYIYGYFPMAKYVCLPVSPAHIVPESFFASRDHLPKGHKPYNQYYRCENDLQYNKEMEDFIMLFRPLFWTSFWCHDWMKENKWFGGRTIIISSASSKTAFCLAYLIKKNTTHNESPSLSVIGLTSESNVSFTKGLGMYDEVLTYDQLKNIDVGKAPFVYVDITGSPKLYTSLVSHLGSHLAKAISVGITQHDSATKGVALRGMELFFTPAWMNKRRESLSAEEILALTGRAWNWFLEDCKKWVTLRKVKGLDEIECGYKEVLNGMMKPESGLVFSMWKSNDEWRAAKL